MIDVGSRDLTVSALLSERDKHCVSSSIVFRCDEHFVEVDADVASAIYIAKLTGLSPFRKYNCSAKARNNVGTSQSTEVKIFSTKQDGKHLIELARDLHCIFYCILGPQAPIDLKYSISDDGHVGLMWTADNSTGLADKFKVVTNLEASFDGNIPNDCNQPSLSESTLYTSQPKIIIKNLQSFSKYSVRVASFNSYGVSDLSKILYIITKPAAPLPPRNLTIIFDYSTTDERKVLAILKWNQPCNLNGKFSLYLISIHGKRPGLEDHSIKTATSFANITFDDLRRGYRYEAKVKAVNLDFPGAFETLFFKAPSGSENSFCLIRF